LIMFFVLISFEKVVRSTQYDHKNVVRYRL